MPNGANVSGEIHFIAATGIAVMCESLAAMKQDRCKTYFLQKAKTVL